MRKEIIRLKALLKIPREESSSGDDTDESIDWSLSCYRHVLGRDPIKVGVF